ncbi:N-succinylarginine dihydrolase [Aliivibrio fischeri]|uniref:N-succinylarginine dihydrolase n=1 Tax=Aliivibrio fischeri TaxID=668 RepID=UPI001F275C7B|nr:N-succinylarginine dihydrolase [Aliivibrio fischeri]MCE7577589.1 N-succinylarginine dihydrolase [Aliivibrio fischeri]MCE7589874.1 N-succinylarginine dihydrolase [Aliivibrio fischeri]
MKAVESNFDGLVGPTHNYSGLSVGNIASKSNQSGVSNPKQAVKQGLEKMKALHDMGFVQGVLAPQERPDIHTLRRLGFSGSDSEVLKKSYQYSPQLLAACSSASSMWTANAGTVSPSADTADGKVHFTPANLINKFHRSIEDQVTGNILKATFPDEEHFVHHQALPHSDYFGDEGAANHTRFCREYGEQGVEFFVFGKSAFNESYLGPKKYPARQTLEASEAIARTHGLREQFTVFAQQNPDVIDQGVFHNDVIAVGNKNTLFCHQQAFLNQEKVKSDLSASYGSGFNVIEVPTDKVSVQDAVETYLFNSQLITKADGTTLIILPEHCRQNSRVWAYLNELVEQKRGIDELHTFDLKQSMQNGGGPACLRLRVVLNEAEQKVVNQHTLMSEELFTTLNLWADKHYRDRIEDKDLADPQLLVESRAALDELTQIMHLGSIYPFQK